MNLLTPAQLTGRKRAGWQIDQTDYTVDYKKQWNSPWYFCREFYQNALDEHDETGITALPSLAITVKGMVIQDQGRGLGAEALMMRETKSEMDLRGHFGEGLKYGCLTAVRLGYTPHIESPYAVIEAYLSPKKMGRVEADFLTFVYKDREPSESSRTGTKITVEGYTGELFKDRFAVFLDKPILTSGRKLGRFTRKETVYTEPKGRLYVGDIYVRDLPDSEYSYNIWGLELNPDRVSELDHSTLLSAIGRLWAQLGSKDVAVKIIKSMTTAKTLESSLNWNYYSIVDKSKWLDAWIELFGPKAVLFTTDYLQKSAEGFGYKVLGKDWSWSTKSILRNLVPTDDSVVESRGKELSKPKLIADDELTEDERTNLNVLRFLSRACDKCRYKEGKPNITAAIIPPDLRTGSMVNGLCSIGERTIYLVRDRFETLETALSTFYHEMGHWIDGNEHADATVEHIHAVQAVASAMSIIIMERYGEVTEIRYPNITYKPISVISTPIPVEVTGTVAPAGPLELGTLYGYTMEQLNQLATERGLTIGGSKRQIANQLFNFTRGMK